MILHNTTFIVAPECVADFKEWVTNVYIPAAVSRGQLNAPVLTRILSPGQEGADTSFALHFRAEDISVVNQWLEGEGGELLEAMKRRHHERMLWFDTPMEILHPEK